MDEIKEEINELKRRIDKLEKTENRRRRMRIIFGTMKLLYLVVILLLLYFSYSYVINIFNSLGG